ncbi:MAG TPA: FAD-binding oxidoreductase [Sediminibacterium sp.]|nr:FAD-binding oxidoreductase [Sediminibacterium sp.]
MQVDYIIVGQGVCGTFLSYYLQRAGCRVLVIDQYQAFSASRIASGVINPITGRRLVKTWEIDTIMPFSVQAYQDIGKALGSILIRQCNTIGFHTTPQMQLAFEERIRESGDFLLRPADQDYWRKFFRYPFGVGEINPTWLVDLSGLLTAWRESLRENQSLLADVFEIKECQCSPAGVVYRDITADKIIFCDGVAGMSHPYFSLLPYARNKGQALIAAIPGLPQTNIFKQAITIVPWRDHLFWIGASFEWEYTHTTPDQTFRENTIRQLDNWLQLPYEILDHLASERPANLERRPFVGIHPHLPAVGILNGMGTKGCSLGPYFASQLADHLLKGTAIHPQADVSRFSKILGRDLSAKN